MTLEVQADTNGILVPELGLHLDPTGPVPFAFFSHAHAISRAALGSRRILCSRETLAIANALYDGHLRSEIDWETSLDAALSGGVHARLTLAPAGHMLGAAQLLVEQRNRRTVYTGDFEPSSGLTYASGGIVKCDQLVIESTYILPIYSFPEKDTVLADMAAWCEEALSNRHTPVIFTQPSIGAAQEIAMSLRKRGLDLALDPHAFEVSNVYAECGYDIGIGGGAIALGTDEHEGPEAAKRVIVGSPRLLSPWLKGLRKITLALASADALIDARVEQHRADKGFVFAAHADHNDLIGYAKACGATELVATYGDANLWKAILEGGPQTVIARPHGAIDSRVEPM